MATVDCLRKLAQAAGRALTDKEVSDIFERVHKAALDIKAGRAEPSDIKLTGRATKGLAAEINASGGSADTLIQQAAERAAREMQHEALIAERQANLQVARFGARQGDVKRLQATGLSPLDAIERTIARDYSGRTNVESLEQKAAGYNAYFGRKLIDTWNSLGSDFLGFLQNREKIVSLIRELRGEDSGEAVAKKGAKAFHDAAEEARKTFNANGGDIGKLDDWGMPQHHSQEKVAAVGKEKWIDQILPMLDRKRYEDNGQAWSEASIRDFLGKAWDTIATNGHANTKDTFKGSGKMANRHAESRQIHFKDAESVISYWEKFGEKTAVEILHGHIDAMAKDIAFVEHFGPNPNMTYQTLRDAALTAATKADPGRTSNLEGKAIKLDELYNYSAGMVKPTYNKNIRAVADGIAHLNTAGKLGGAMLASLFGDKPMMEAVSHMNDLPVFKRWQTELSLLNPANSADRDLLQRQGLMLEGIRSGLQRFYEGLGQSSTTGRIANAVMRVTGMQAINEVRKGAFGLSLMDAIGTEISRGVEFDKLHESDIRTLRNYGITKEDWDIWKLAKPDQIGTNKHVLTPESIGRISDADMQVAGIVPTGEQAQAARRGAIVKLLGAVNTESDFAIVTPGWKERASFYGDLQRGTFKGEIARSVLQFKAFPWAMFQRGMDAVANMDGPTSKAAMVSWLVLSTTIAGAMLMQTRDMLSGKDPRKMADENWYKFWAAAFLQGGALGIYGDFIYSVDQSRYGAGPLEAMAGPTIGPLLSMGVVQPLQAAKKAMDGKPTHLAAQTIAQAKGFIPGNNVWYTKAATEHLVWQRVMDALSPGYLASMRQRSRKEMDQDWWWRPGEVTPERAPDFASAVQ